MASKRDHGTGFADAVAATLVAALALPILRLRTGTAITDLPVLAQAGVLTLGIGSVGALLGATVGVGLWKRVLVARATGARARITPAVGGVLLGTVLGQAAWLGVLRLVGADAFDPPLLIVVLPVGLAGAAVLVAGLGELWARVSSRFDHPPSPWIPAVAVSGLLFASVVWAAGVLVLAVADLGGAGVTEALLWTLPAPMASVAIVLACSAAWASTAARRPRHQQAGSARDPAPGPAGGPGVGHAAVVGVLAGAAATAALAVNGSAAITEGGERSILLVTYVAAAAGAAAGLALAVAHGRHGHAMALLAGPIGSVVGCAAVLGPTSPVSAVGVLEPVLHSMGIGLLALLATAWLVPTGDRAVARPAAAFGIAVALSAAAAAGIVSEQDVLAPPLPAPAVATLGEPADLLDHVTATG